MAEAYCVKDKRKVEVQNPQRITMKNGKRRAAAQRLLIVVREPRDPLLE